MSSSCIEGGDVLVCGCSLLGLLFLTADLLINGELAALDGDKDVGVLISGRHELSHNILLLLGSSHSQRLKALKTVLIINLELLKGEACVLDEVREEGSILHGLDHIKVVGEVLDGDACM